MRAPLAAGVLAVLVMAGGGYLYWIHETAGRVPAGLASANGRIEVERVDIASKLPGRIAEIRIKEGDLVEAGSVIARLDTAELLAQLAAARASVQRAQAGIGRAEADIVIRQAEHHLSEVEMQRASELERRAAGTTAEAERRTAEYDVAGAQILGARAALEDAVAAKQQAEAAVAQIEAMIADTTLTTPATGRVEYKLVQTGEVVAAGGRVATVLDVDDVYMTIFLPTGAAGSVAMGSEARILLDAAPDYVIPATVSFVSAQAQFTPKAVETENEREKLMYRVKLSIDPALLARYRDYVKSGLTGNAYVKIDPAAAWPASLAPRLPDVASAN
jgi:HlyD family secretion protein